MSNAPYLTTLTAIRAEGPCNGGWTTLLAHLGKTKADDEPLNLLTVLEANGLLDTLWCIEALRRKEVEFRHLAVWLIKRWSEEVKIALPERSMHVLLTVEKACKGDGSMKEALALTKEALNDLHLMFDSKSSHLKRRSVRLVSYLCYEDVGYSLHTVQTVAEMNVSSMRTLCAEKLKSVLKGEPV